MNKMMMSDEQSAKDRGYVITIKVDAKGETTVILKSTAGNVFAGHASYRSSNGYTDALHMAVAHMLQFEKRYENG